MGFRKAQKLYWNKTKYSDGDAPAIRRLSTLSIYQQANRFLQISNNFHIFVRLYVNISMGLILQNITALILSVLLVAGSNGLSLYAHFCEIEPVATVSFQQENCAHEQHSCAMCELPLQVKENHKNTPIIEKNCCETQQYRLQFDQFTDNFNKTKKELKSPVIKVKCKPVLEQLLMLHQQTAKTETNDFITDIAPILSQSRLNQLYHCIKTGPDPDLV